MVWGQLRKYVEKLEDYERDHPCAAGVAVEPFSAVCVAVCYIYVDRTTRYYFVVKNISCEKFSWFGPTTKIFS